MSDGSTRFTARGRRVDAAMRRERYGVTGQAAMLYDTDAGDRDEGQARWMSR
jgi:hypothetical protein